MARRDKYNFPISFRVDGEQKDYIEELKQQGINLRDVLDYYRDNTTNERARLNNEEKRLLKQISQLEIKLDKARNELMEVREQLGKTPADNQARIDVLEAKEKIINNCKIENNGNIDPKTLANYMGTKKAKRLIKSVIVKNGVNDEEEFMKQLYKLLKL